MENHVKGKGVQFLRGFNNYSSNQGLSLLIGFHASQQSDKICSLRVFLWEQDVKVWRFSLEVLHTWSNLSLFRSPQLKQVITLTFPELITQSSAYLENLSLWVLHTWGINTANLGDQSVYGNCRLKETWRLSQDHRTAHLKKYDLVMFNILKLASAQHLKPNPSPFRLKRSKEFFLIDTKLFGNAGKRREAYCQMNQSLSGVFSSP